MTKIKIINSQIKYQNPKHNGLLDSLTGCYTRNFYQTELNSILKDAYSNQKTLICILININQFKQINRFYTSRTGDLLLIELVQRMIAFFKPPSSIIRMSGDEFLIIADNTSSINIESFHHTLVGNYNLAIKSLDKMLRIAYHITNKLPLESEELYLCLSSSLAFAKNDHSEIIEHNPSHNIMQEVRLNSPQYLQQLIESKCFELHLQPIVGTNNETVAYEILLRMNVDGKYISPDEFLDFFIANNYSAKINSLVINMLIDVLNHNTLLQTKLSGKKVSINLIPCINNFAEHLQQITATIRRNQSLFTNIKLEFEIIERHFMLGDRQSTTFYRDISEILSEANITLSLDDFGIDFSNLQRLMTCNFKTIKIDKLFTHSLGLNKDNINQKALAIFTTINLLSELLELDVVVEGIENNWQLDCLKSLGYKYFQGYLFSKPLPILELIKIT